jgi:3-deoxy-D-manno-octulosonate 8-phosphate phosphatase (KDO 8-P phosphatase)
MQIIQPALHFPPELLRQAQGIKVVFFDVDGVLTDGGLYFSEHGETLKRFSTLDGHGLKLLKHVGITPVIITGRDSKPLRVRLKALGIEHAKFGTEDKLPAAEDFLKTLQRAAISCAPINAHAQALALAHFVTSRQGGFGAAREFCDLLVVASGQYATLLAGVGSSKAA